MSWDPATQTALCDGRRGCESVITHIDNKGFIYCTHHGLWRRQYQPCRKLRDWELRKIQRGEPLKRY